jgi:hypothetical protein
MGGKAKSSNDQMVQFEMQQAAEAKQKEADRQARLSQGTAAVNSIFDASNDPTNPNYIDYNKYNQAQLDYYQPQLQTQYEQAKRKLTYDLARGGTLRSKGAADAAGILNTENLTGDAALRAQADTSTANLRSTVQNEKQTALNQVFSTEDPSIAANTATSMVQQGAVAAPNLNPLGAMFSPIAVGATAGLTNLINQSYVNKGINAANPTGTGALTTTQYG